MFFLSQILAFLLIETSTRRAEIYLEVTRGYKKWTDHLQLFATCYCVERLPEMAVEYTSSFCFPHTLVTQYLPLFIFTIILLQVTRLRSNSGKSRGIFKSIFRQPNFAHLFACLITKKKLIKMAMSFLSALCFPSVYITYLDESQVHPMLPLKKSPRIKGRKKKGRKKGKQFPS